MIMDYKLAKKLRDDGFPGMEEFAKNPFKKGELGYKTWEKGYLVPTLSELIEACGDEFIALKKGGLVWSVESLHDIFGHGGERKYNWLGGNFSPEEAVAKLWLELNK